MILIVDICIRSTAASKQFHVERLRFNHLRSYHFDFPLVIVIFFELVFVIAIKPWTGYYIDREVCGNRVEDDNDCYYQYFSSLAVDSNDSL